MPPTPLTLDPALEFLGSNLSITQTPRDLELSINRAESWLLHVGHTLHPWLPHRAIWSLHSKRDENPLEQAL